MKIKLWISPKITEEERAEILTSQSNLLCGIVESPQEADLAIFKFLSESHAFQENPLPKSTHCVFLKDDTFHTNWQRIPLTFLPNFIDTTSKKKK